jgi:hypothetical protein
MFTFFVPEFGKILKKDKWSNAYYADPVEQKEAGLWLKAYHKGSPPIIMSLFQTVSFYAGNYNIRQSVTIPQNELDRILAYAEHRDVEYLILNERFRMEYPKIAYLIEGDDVPKGLDLIYKKENPSGLKTTIYKINKENHE